MSSDCCSHLSLGKVNALKGILQYIKSNEFKEEFGDDLYLILHRLNQDCVESYFSIQGKCVVVPET